MCLSSFQDALPARPPSAPKQSKPDLIHHHRRNILVDSSSNLSTKGNSSPSTSCSEQTPQPRLVPYRFTPSSWFNYDIVAAAAIEQSDYLHEEDSEDDDDDSHDDDDEQQHPRRAQQQSLSPPPALIPVNSKRQQVLTSRSFSPSLFCQKKHHSYEQEPFKSPLFHSSHQDRMTKNLIGQHESTAALDTFAQSSINTILTSSYPSVTLGESVRRSPAPDSRLAGPVGQETAIATSATASGNETSTGAVLVDYLSRISPTLHTQQVPLVATTSRVLSATMTKRASICEEPKAEVATLTTTPASAECTLDNADERVTSNSELVCQQSQLSPMLDLLDDGLLSPTNGLISAASIRDEKSEPYRKRTGDVHSRNDTSLSKPMWTDDDDQLILGDECGGEERTSTSQSMLSHHRNSSSSTAVITPMPTLPSVMKKSTLPSTKQQFFHHHKSSSTDQPQSKLSPRPLMPFSLSKYRRIPANVHSLASSQQQTYASTSNTSANELTNNGNGHTVNSTDSFSEHLILNKRIEMLKPTGKQPATPPAASSPSASAAIFPTSSAHSKRHSLQQDGKSTGGASLATPPTSSLIPLDNTKVTIGRSRS